MVGFFLRRPVTVCMLLGVLTILGVLSYQRIPLQLLPSGFVLTRVSVRIHCKGMAPEEIVRQVAEPLEGSMLTISRVVRVKSMAVTSRLSMEVVFQEGTDMDFAYREVWDRLERVRGELPEDIRRRDILVFKRSTDDIPIAAVAASYPKNLQNLDQIVEVRLRSPLARIPGVANVDAFGFSEQAIFVDLNYHRLKANRVGVLPLVQSLRGVLLSQPSGKVHHQGKTLHLRVVSQFQSLEQLRQMEVKPHVHLKSLGTVKMAMPAPPFLATIEGKPALLLLIYKESDANTVAVCDAVEQAIETMRSPQLKPVLIFSQGQLVRKALEDLQSTALWGGLFAVAVLFLFLWRLSLTLLVALAVPFSLLLTLTAMYFLGKSLNLLSLMGIMLAIGMVVDNSIVVVESIARDKELGASAFQAALEGTQQVVLAITAATATSVVVFLPFFLLESSFRFWLEEIGFPICLALLSSLFVSVFFIPLGASRFLGRGQKESTDRWWQKAYRTLLGWILQHRFEASLFLILVSASVYWPIKNLPRTDRVRGHSGSVKIDLRFPGSRGLEDAEKRIRRFEQLMLRKKKELDIVLVRTFFSVQRGSIVLHQPMDRKPRLSPEEFFQKLRQLIPRVPGVVAKLHGENVGGSSPEVKVRILGRDSRELLRIAHTLKEKLESLPEVLDVRLDEEADLDELHLIPRREVLERFEITPMQLAQTVRWSLNGAPLPPAQWRHREVVVQVALRKEDRKNLAVLKNLEIRSPSAKIAPLGLLAQWRHAKGLTNIVRLNKKHQVALTLVLGKEHLSQLMPKLKKLLREVPLPEGYEFHWGDRFRKFRELMRVGGFAILLAILLVFLLMGVLFESVLLPLSIMVSVPLAFWGVYWLLFLSGTPIEVMSLLGMVLLVGIVVNNAIVLVERIQRRRLWESREEAILNAAQERLRPILMTALTTIFGLIPMALGDANLVGRPYYPLGRAVIGGLISSTFLTLFAVPLFYTFLDDLQSLFWGERPSPKSFQ